MVQWRSKVAWLAGLACIGLMSAPPVRAASTGELDDVEAGICSKSTALKSAITGAEDMRRQPLPSAPASSGVDVQRQAFLRREIASRLLAAQDSMVASTRRELQDYQARYRQLTGGREFDTTQCDGGRVRVTHAMREQERREKDMQATMDMTTRVLAEGEAYRQGIMACDAWKIMQWTPQEAARRFPPGYQNTSRQDYAAATAAYQRASGRPFNPASCR